MQVYVPLNTEDVGYDHDTKPLSHALAQLLEEQHPKLSCRSEEGAARGKVLIDWSQNDEHKTTVCVYSLRARERPTVSTPLDWEEVEAAIRTRSSSRPARCSSASRSTATCSRRWPAGAEAARALRARRERPSGPLPRTFGSMVDWSLARQVARFAAGPSRRADLGVDLPALVAEIEAHGGRLHRADAATRRCRRPSWSAAREWAAVNLDTLAELLDPVAARLDAGSTSRARWRGRCEMGAARRWPPRPAS